MCGIAGFWFRPPRPRSETESLLRAMTAAVAARGPDDEGLWFDETAGVGLGHRRLAVIDLSPAGRQPMVSSCGRWAVSFNGEIYNHPELRAELAKAGRALRGRSDTEVLVEAVSLWGFEDALARFVGMFAFALWDRRDRRLHLVRDRLGKKPMYYALRGGALLFGSQLRALCAAPGFDRAVDRSALAFFLRYLYIPAPHAIYRGVAKLAPGQRAVIGESGDGLRAELHTYWDAARAAAEGGARPLDGAPEEVLGQFEGVLRDAVGARLVSDVPLGVLLSGGIDSSTVTALAQEQLSRAARTFTVGFAEPGYDESRFARAIARHLGTDHSELTVTAREALDVVPSLADVYDEPFADASQIPTVALSRAMRRHVTVALSGDGGDELFAGYDRYRWAERLWKTIKLSPRALRTPARAVLTAVPAESWDGLLRWARARTVSGQRIHRAADILASADADELYRLLMTHWTRPDELLGDLEGPDPLVEQQRRLPVDEPLRRMMLLDLKTYLPEDVLVKVDRASMSVALEVRAPLLDHRVVEFAWRLPQRYKLRGRTSKWLMRQALYKRVPRALVDRAKRGFGAPVAEWLRGPLRGWAEDLLSDRALAGAGLAAAPVRRHWREHVNGRRDWAGRLWAVLMYQAWRARWSS